MKCGLTPRLNCIFQQRSAGNTRSPGRVPHLIKPGIKRFECDVTLYRRYHATFAANLCFLIGDPPYLRFKLLAHRRWGGSNGGCVYAQSILGEERKMLFRTVFGKKAGADCRHRGAVAVMVAVMMTVIIGVAALTVDIGAMYNAKADLQRTADAAALAAAARLSAYDEGNPAQLAVAEAQSYIAKNGVFAKQTLVADSGDIEVGRAEYNEQTKQYDFSPTTVYPDAVRVRVRLTEDSSNGPLGLYFARFFGYNAAEMSAEAIAMMVPRDIAIVADLSASHTDDSELRHLNLTQINLFDVWAAFPIQKGNAGVGNGLDPPPPGNPNNENDQPGTGPGSPANAGGNPNPGADPFNDSEAHGPRWGWMTAYGSTITYNELTHSSDYNPTADIGLYYIPRYQDTTDPDVIENLTQAGYTESERNAILSSAYDSSSSHYNRRVQIMLGLAGWRSKMKDENNQRDSKYNGGPGDGDNYIDSNELWQQLDYPFDSGSWSSYIDYVRNSSSMTSGDGDSRLRYRYGIKTVINYTMESKPSHNQTPELANAPVQPMQAVKDAVSELIDMLVELDTNDQVSLEGYDRYGRHLEDLVGSDFNFDTITPHMNSLQGGHYDVWTNVGDGIQEATRTLTNSGGRPDLAREVSRKVIFLLTDGNANTNQNHQSSSSNYNILSQARSWALNRAQDAVDNGIRIYTVSVGADSDQSLMDDIAALGGGVHLHTEGSIEEYSTELRQIFSILGGTRPVELIR